MYIILKILDKTKLVRDLVWYKKSNLSFNFIIDLCSFFSLLCQDNEPGSVLLRNQEEKYFWWEGVREGNLCIPVEFVMF